MMSETDGNDQDRSGVEHFWSEREVRPAILLHVAGVFAGFLALAHFAFRSADAVEALVLAGVAAMAATVPGTLKKTEYHLSPEGLSKRPLSQKRLRDFVEVFTWEELSHLFPTKSGFKYYKELDEPNRLRRFLKVHFQSGHSGEFQVGPGDRARVETIIGLKGIPRSEPAGALEGGR